MIEAWLAFVVTVMALGWIIWRLRHYQPRNWIRLVIVLLLMVLVAYAVEAYLPDHFSLRVQLWFGTITSVLMAVATYVETEPKKR